MALSPAHCELFSLSFCVVMFSQDSSNSVSKIRTSLLNLVDLAGSERQRDTQSVGMRLKVTQYLIGCFHKVP